MSLCPGCDGTGVSNQSIPCRKCKETGKRGNGRCSNCHGLGRYHVSCDCLSELAFPKALREYVHHG